MRLARPFLIALLAAAALVGAGAQSLNLNFDTAAYVAGGATASGSLSQGASLAAGLPFGKASKLGFKLDASLGLSFGGAGTDFSYPRILGESPYLDNMDLQELSYSYNGNPADEGLSGLSFTAGRFPYTDPTGALYSYRLDGILIGASYPLLTMRAIMGYSGLLPGSAPIIGGTSDASFGNEGFAAPRVLAGFSIRPKKILNHDIYLAFIAQEDLRHQSQLAQEYGTTLYSELGGPMDSAYLTGGFSGAVSAISYSGFGVFQFGRRLSYMDPNDTDEYAYSYSPVLAMSLGANLRYAFNPRLSLSGRFLLGSGDADATSALDGNSEGKATFFIPITSASSGLAFSPNPGNVSFLEVSARISPFSGGATGLGSLQVTPKSIIFLKNGKGPISEAGVDPATSGGLLGFEQDASATMKILSDATLSLSAGLFFPFKEPLGVFDASYVDESPIQYYVRAGLALAL